MKVTSLEWDDHNIEHIARHGVSPQEVEEVCFGLHICMKERVDRYVLSGKTPDGRYLIVVIQRLHADAFRPITAFDMSEDYRRLYKRRVERGRKSR